MNKNLKNHFRICFGKNVETEHFPITLASGLDVLLKPDGYKRVSQIKTNHEEFVWGNTKEEQFTVNYYTQVNSITSSAMFDEDLSKNKNDTVKRLGIIYNNLDTTIGAISQYLGSPYVSSTRELKVKIEGNNLIEKTQFLTPIIKELYKKKEGVQLFNIDTLEQTDSSIQILFSFLE